MALTPLFARPRVQPPGGDYGLSMDDIIVDVAISALASDTEGLTRASLRTVEMIGRDPDLKGIHMSGGLTDLAARLPIIEIDGAPLRVQLESAFLTLAMPHGFDVVLATPGRAYRILGEDSTVSLRCFGRSSPSTASTRCGACASFTHRPRTEAPAA